MALHPVLTAADTALMTPHERAYFTDEPIAHRIAQLDFERHIAIDRRSRAAMRAHSTRHPVVMDRAAAQVLA